jgi:CRP-like cAMP-binding protein
MTNLILRSLPKEEHAAIMGHSTPVNLSQSDVIHQYGHSIEDVYFPESGMVSLLTGRNGRAIATGVVGREGVVGSKVVLGSHEAHGAGIVHLSGHALRMPTARFLQAYAQLPTFTRLVNDHIGLLLFQAEQNALCHAHHSIESRFCRWLLQAADRLDSNVLELTQESCAQTLGVQRTSVSMVAHTLQLAGAIRTRRGKIEILDRGRLVNAACECYGQVKERFDTAYSAYSNAA